MGSKDVILFTCFNSKRNGNSSTQKSSGYGFPVRSDKKKCVAILNRTSLG